MKHKKLTTFLIILVAVFMVLFAALRNPRVLMLISTLRFSTETLNNPSYIAYQVDLMELCREYLNADTTLSGKALLDESPGINSSMSMDVTGERSFSQKKFSCIADLSVLALDMGNFEFYAEDRMFYMAVPMLDDLAYAFDTGINLFAKAPDLTSDLDAAWFQRNRQNIVDLVGDIRVEKVEDVIEDGVVKSKGYLVTIPEGSGLFIWELLGIDPPDRDVRSTIYLTPFGQVRRVVIDLTEALKDSPAESAILTIDGTDCGTAILSLSLPENESLSITAIRNGKLNTINTIDYSTVYHSNTGQDLCSSGSFSWEDTENGVSIKLHNSELTKDEETLISAYFEGEIKKEAIEGDVFRDAPEAMYAAAPILWSDLRGNADEFFKSVMDEIKERMMKSFHLASAETRLLPPPESAC